MTSSTSQSSTNKGTPSSDPKAQAAISMACAMALHFFGYEFARGSNTALFTSSSLGFGASSGSYYPLAMACVSPMSMMLLFGYGRQLDAKGPRRALRNTTLLCISALALSGLGIAALQYNNGLLLGKWTASQLIVWISFVFQNSYAHLLYAQQWSFLGSIFTPSQAGQYYSYVAGLSSISSMIAGASLSKVVKWVGLPGLLGMAASALSCTLILADHAYAISEKHGFDPSLEMQKQKKKKKQSTKQDGTTQSHSLSHQIQEGVSLFRRVPTLGALFCETITFQSLCTILNTCLVTQLKDSVRDDAQRAAWTGRFYATTNGLSTIFQFCLMPILTQYVEPKTLWRLMPLLPLGCAVLQSLPPSLISSLMSPSSALYLVAISFLAAKTMDYSLRNVLAELVYVPLDFESRYVGKEIIAVFANRFGKSGMAVILSGLNFLRGGTGGFLPGLALFVSMGWWSSAVSLSSLLLGKEEAERVVAERIGTASDGDAKDDHAKKS
eukprot:scaffold15572_cov200-Alexandrium_tamarense.AAC.1